MVRRRVDELESFFLPGVPDVVEGRKVKRHIIGTIQGVEFPDKADPEYKSKFERASRRLDEICNDEMVPEEDLSPERLPREIPTTLRVVPERPNPLEELNLRPTVEEVNGLKVNGLTGEVTVPRFWRFFKRLVKTVDLEFNRDYWKVLIEFQNGAQKWVKLESLEQYGPRVMKINPGDYVNSLRTPPPKHGGVVQMRIVKKGHRDYNKLMKQVQDSRERVEQRRRLLRGE